MPLTSLMIAAGAVHIVWSLRADPARVWSHLTDSENFQAWLGTLQIAEFEEGGRVVVDHGDGYVCDSTITLFEPGQRFTMTWEFPDEPESGVSVLVAATGDDETLFVLSHTDLADLTASYAPGWLTHLTYFEGSLEGNPLPPEQFWRIHQSLTSLCVRHDPASEQTVFSVLRTVQAPRRDVWESVADPAQHHCFDATGMVGSLASAKPRAVGDVFTMNMTYWDGQGHEDYQSDNHVLVFDPETCIAWATALPGGAPLGWTWRYDLEDAPSGTSVRLTYDWTEASSENVARFDVPLADPAALILSLERLARLVETQ